MFGEFEEGDVFFADAVEDADGLVFFVGEADNLRPEPPEIALERGMRSGGVWKMLLE